MRGLKNPNTREKIEKINGIVRDRDRIAAIVGIRPIRHPHPGAIGGIDEVIGRSERRTIVGIDNIKIGSLKVWRRISAPKSLLGMEIRRRKKREQH